MKQSQLVFYQMLLHWVESEQKGNSDSDLEVAFHGCPQQVQSEKGKDSSRQKSYAFVTKACEDVIQKRTGRKPFAIFGCQENDAIVYSVAWHQQRYSFDYEFLYIQIHHKMVTIIKTIPKISFPMYTKGFTLT